MTSGPIDRSTDAELEQMLRAGEEDDAALPAGSHVGRYVVLEKVGAGGMSVVYKAYDPQLDRAIALKLLRAAPLGSDRVLREAQALAKLSHPNIVAVHDVGVFGDQVFAAMEYVAGETLGTWCRGDRSPEEILRAFREAGRGLAVAHAAGLVHRDFKPDNVIVGRDGRVRVLDFGLARAAGAPEGAPAPGAAVMGRDVRITRDGAIVGTPAYMAPEQHRRLEADARSDQWSFCAALFEALHGRLPFAGESVEALAEAVLTGRVAEPPSESRAPGWVRPLVVRGLAVDPADRWPSMDLLLAALDRDPRSRRRWAALAASAAVLVAVLALWLGRAAGDPCGGAAARLRGVWDEHVKSAVRTAFARSGRAHAGPTFERVARVLDGQAAEWVAMQRQVCEARRAGRESAREGALRQGCLDQRRRELAALATRFKAAKAGVVDGAVHRAFGLASVAACADAAALELARPAPPKRAVGPNECGVPAAGRYFPLEVGRVWVYDVIDKATRRSHGDPKVVTVEGPMPIGGCKPDETAYRTRQASREGWAFRWQEALPVPSPPGRRPGQIVVRHRDQFFAADGTMTKDVYFVPSRIRLDESCANGVLGATYLDAYDQVEVASGGGCGETVRRETRTFEWQVVGVDVPLQIDLDYRHPACCPEGNAACGPPPDGPGHACRPAEDGPGRFACVFRTLQIDRREVSGGTAESTSFAVDVGKVVDDEKGEDREVLTCFARPRGP